MATDDALNKGGVMSDEAKQLNTVIKVNGKEANLRKSVPLTIGDMKKLKKEHGVNLAKLGNDGIDIDDMSSLLYYISHKANSDITVDDVDMLPSSSLGNIMTIFQELQKEIDPPF